ncbi:MAG TPA: tetraacyldisaccharide 4'-kinase [Terriglobales bacterium]|nr:tetraacyldisaccharide 4'-kinase [Terriglobales bacterium]
MASLAAHLFGSLVRARDRAYQQGWLGVARLPAPVISVGNLAVGGRGKTPTVIALGAALRQRGLRLDVLTRGYGRAARRLEVAQTGAEEVARVGDEPRLIAQRLQVPVLVHPDRFRAGLEGERRFHSQLHLLDDGFQHRQLARAFDLVLLAPQDLDDRLLPAGRLREPPTALARASALLWLSPDSDLAGAQRRLAAFSSAPVFLARKRPVPLPLGRPFAFCGLAQPESFWASLAELGVAPAGRRAFGDHHRYRHSDLRALQAAARAAGADGFVTTAKDAANLPAGLENLHVLEIEMEIPELPRLLQRALEACGL